MGLWPRLTAVRRTSTNFVVTARVAFHPSHRLSYIWARWSIRGVVVRMPLLLRHLFCALLAHALAGVDAALLKIRLHQVHLNE